MATLFRRLRHGKASLRWYARFIVPADLRAVLDRREVLKSLGVVAYSEASLRAAVWEGKLATLLLQIRRHRSSMSPEQIRRLLQQYISTRLDEWEHSWYGGERPACDRVDVVYEGDCPEEHGTWQAIEARLAKWDERKTVGALKSNRLEGFESAGAMEDFFQRYGLRLEKGTSLYRLASREMVKAQQTIAREIQKRVRGNYEGVAVPGPLIVAAPGTWDGKETPLPPGPPLLLSVVREDYLKDHERQAPGTKEAKRAALRLFLEILGDKDLRSVTPQECLRYRDALTKLPAHMTKRYTGKTVAEVLKETEGKNGIQRLSLSTVNKQLSFIQGFFTWAIAPPRSYLTRNPVEGVSYQDVESVSYDPFTDEDLRRLFTCDEYKQQLQQPGREYARYWLPLILLYTGARREEIAGLAGADVKTEAGVHYFDITPDEARGRRLKTKVSRRSVPIHSHLLELGFLEYVGQCQRSKGGLLFPTRQPARPPQAAGKSGAGGRRRWTTQGDAVGKWWARLLKQQHVTGKKALHSFRSTLTTKLHEAGVDGETRRKLLGHSGEDVHEQTYLRPHLPTLQAALEKLDFRQLLKGLPRFCL